MHKYCHIFFVAEFMCSFWRAAGKGNVRAGLVLCTVLKLSEGVERFLAISSFTDLHGAIFVVD